MSGIDINTVMGGLPDTDFHHWMDDFDFYLATSWVNTETGSGTQAVAQAKDGIFVITNAAADDDENWFQATQLASGAVAENWAHVSGKRLYWGMRFKISDATEAEFAVGLQVTDTAPLAVADGIFFRKDDGDANLDFVASASSTDDEDLAIAVLADDTYMTLEFYYDGSSSYITAFKDGVAVGSLPISSLPTTELAISFGIKNGEAVAKIMSVDWIKVMQERGS